MGLIRIMERGGDDYYEYKKALKEAKESIKKAHESIEEIYEITEEMESSFSKRGSMRDDRDWDSMSDRRRR